MLKRRQAKERLQKMGSAHLCHSASLSISRRDISQSVGQSVKEVVHLFKLKCLVRNSHAFTLAPSLAPCLPPCLPPSLPPPLPLLPSLSPPPSFPLSFPPSLPT